MKTAAIKSLPPLAPALAQRTDEEVRLHVVRVRPRITRMLLIGVWSAIALIGAATTVVLLRVVTWTPTIQGWAVGPDGAYYEIELADVEVMRSRRLDPAGGVTPKAAPVGARGGA